MQLFDTHAHLTSEQFNEDRDKLLSSLMEKGVKLVLDCAADEEDFEGVYKNCSYEYIYGAYGIHPHSASKLTEGWQDNLKKYLALEKCVALGEIGLDYHYDFSPRDTQIKIFKQQLEIALELSMPVILHDREAHKDMYDILSSFKGLKGVMHCYSGSAEMVNDYVKLGLYLGFGGSLTFKNAKKTVEAARIAPMELILIETDCPYLTPIPHRGKRNDPSYTSFVCEMLAKIKGVSADEMSMIALENGKRLFGINGA